MGDLLTLGQFVDAVKLAYGLRNDPPFEFVEEVKKDIRFRSLPYTNWPTLSALMRPKGTRKKTTTRNNRVSCGFAHRGSRLDQQYLLQMCFESVEKSRSESEDWRFLRVAEIPRSLAESSWPSNSRNS